MRGGEGMVQGGMMTKKGSPKRGGNTRTELSLMYRIHTPHTCSEASRSSAKVGPPVTSAPAPSASWGRGGAVEKSEPPAPSLAPAVGDVGREPSDWDPLLVRPGRPDGLPLLLLLLLLLLLAFPPPAAAVPVWEGYCRSICSSHKCGWGWG